MMHYCSNICQVSHVPAVSGNRSVNLPRALQRPRTVLCCRSTARTRDLDFAKLAERPREGPSFLRSIVPAIAAAALLITPLHVDAAPNATLEATTDVVVKGAARSPSSTPREVWLRCPKRGC